MGTELSGIEKIVKTDDKDVLKKTVTNNLLTSRGQARFLGTFNDTLNFLLDDNEFRETMLDTVSINKNTKYYFCVPMNYHDQDFLGKLENSGARVYLTYSVPGSDAKFLVRKGGSNTYPPMFYRAFERKEKNSEKLQRSFFETEDWIDKVYPIDIIKPVIGNENICSRVINMLDNASGNYSFSMIDDTGLLFEDSVYNKMLNVLSNKNNEALFQIVIPDDYPTGFGTGDKTGNHIISPGETPSFPVTLSKLPKNPQLEERVKELTARGAEVIIVPWQNIINPKAHSICENSFHSLICYSNKETGATDIAFIFSDRLKLGKNYLTGPQLY